MADPYLPPGCTQRECDEAQPGYWDEPEPDEAPEQYECDCCARMTPVDQLARCIAYGIETVACDQCRQ